MSPFRDITPTSPFYTEICWLHDQDVINGWPDGTFRPEQPVTREAVAAFLARLNGPYRATSTTFTDIGSSPFRAEIMTMADLGVIKGWGDNTFRPQLPVSREATAAFLSRLAGQHPPGW